MRLWMSGEVDADVGDGEHIARNAIEPAVNRLLDGLVFHETFEEWAFLSIILSDKFAPAFPELVRRSPKKKMIEFRLVISHEDFKGATPKKQIKLILDALNRSVDLMLNLKVSADGRQKFRDVLTQVRKSLLVEEGNPGHEKARVK